MPRVMSDKLNVCVIWLTTLCFFAMLAISATGTVYKVVTGDGLSWTYSLARQFLPWFALLSITIGYHAKEHVAMTLILSHVPSRIRILMAALIRIIWLSFALVLVIFGTSFAFKTMQIVMISDTLQIPQSWVMASLPVSGFVMLVHCLCKQAETLNAPEAPDCSATSF